MGFANRGIFVALVNTQLLPNGRTITDATFSPPPTVGTLGGITYRSTVHAYNLAFKADTGVWIHLRKGVDGRDYGATFDRLQDDATPLQNALNETMGGIWGLSMRSLWIPCGQSLIGTTLTPYTGGGSVIRGEGNNSSVLLLNSGLNSPVLSSQGLSGARRFVRDLRFAALSKIGHLANFPLFDDSGNDVGSNILVAAEDGPGDGIWHTGYTFGGTLATSDVRWWFPACNRNEGNGIFLDEMSKHLISGGIFAVNGKVGLYIRGHSNRAWGQSSAHGISTELNRGMGVRIERTANAHIFDWYSDNECSGIVTDNSYRNVIENANMIGNQLTGSNAPPTTHNAVFYNMDHWTVARNLQGVICPFDDAVGYHLPGSIVLDPYESFLDSSAWKTAGTGSASKNYSLDGIRFVRWFGKRPTRISVGTVASGNYTYKEVNCAAGDSIDFYVYWWAANLSGVTIRIVDDATPAVDLFNSGVLSHRSQTTSDWGEERYFLSFRVPTGVTKLRLILQPSGAGIGNAVYAGRIDALASRTVVNPGMQSITGFTYAGGIASGWSALSGAGTPSEETVIKKFLGSSSQKIVCASGQSKYLSQTVTLDSSRWYEIRGWIYVPSTTVRTVNDGVTNGTTTITSATANFTANDIGRPVTGSADLFSGAVILSVTNSTTAVLNVACSGSNSGQTFNLGGVPQAAMIGLGNDLTSDYVVRLPAFNTDEWFGVQAFVKPDSSHTKLIFGLRGEGTAYFQFVSLTPLRERSEQWWRHNSAELDLAGAASTSYIFTPTLDEVIRRIIVTFTAATGAGSATVNVGVPGDAARFGSLIGSAAQWDQKEIVLTRSDLRTINPGTAGALPLQVSTPGGGTAGYKAFVTVEGGGTL